MSDEERGYTVSFSWVIPGSLVSVQNNPDAELRVIGKELGVGPLKTTESEWTHEEVKGNSGLMYTVETANWVSDEEFAKLTEYIKKYRGGGDDIIYRSKGDELGFFYAVQGHWDISNILPYADWDQFSPIPITDDQKLSPVLNIFSTLDRLLGDQGQESVVIDVALMHTKEDLLELFRVFNLAKKVFDVEGTNITSRFNGVDGDASAIVDFQVLGGANFLYFYLSRNAINNQWQQGMVVMDEGYRAIRAVDFDARKTNAKRLVSSLEPFFGFIRNLIG